MVALKTVCIVDPDDTITRAMATLLRRYDIEVRSWRDAASFRAALDSATGGAFCLLIGLEPLAQASFPLVRELRQRGFRFPVILLATGDGEAIREAALGAGATDVVDKALVYPYLFSRLNRLLPGSVTTPENIPSTVALRDGTRVRARIIDPGDADMHQDFVTALSAESRYLRFFSGLRALPPAFLKELTSPDFPSSHAIIATVEENGQETEIGVARFAATSDPDVAEFAVVVADDWHGRGIGKHLMHGIILSASIAGFRQLEGIVLRENLPMIKLAESLAFHPVTERGIQDSAQSIRVTRDLHTPDATP